ncbi:MAG TPA: type II toxin-antitoxin system HicB family antitoxin [Treponemataceae bacterium]|jgi:hypothetical protein|nr:type II toxin-antitoxin system HicB family antitoxin [Treponemataceae bacterium]HQL33864.1 type II toxin-antitoxin system HicB family antitoxin [Treponemataceae bacterium]
MKNLAYTWWKDEDFYLGYLNEYPEYETQGVSLEELQNNLREIYSDIDSGTISYIKHVSELTIA